jgi:hypothetical protein
MNGSNEKACERKRGHKFAGWQNYRKQKGVSSCLKQTNLKTVIIELKLQLSSTWKL